MKFEIDSVRCSNDECGKSFTLHETATACYCPYCGTYDEIRDDDTDTDNTAD